MDTMAGMQRKLKKLLEGCGAEMEDNTECSHQSVSSLFSISSVCVSIGKPL